MKKYYEAYDERYKTIHEKNLSWFGNQVTPEVIQWLNEEHIPLSTPICDVGCGEGRDLIALAKLGYPMTGIDVSQEAIRYCHSLATHEQLNVSLHCMDALNVFSPKQFHYLYSVATLHMLVLQEDRIKFLRSLYQLLEPNGSCLLVNMGNGLTERKTDIDHAFDLVNRHHMGSNQDFLVASTSFCTLELEQQIQEIKAAHFILKDARITQNDEYGTCMTLNLTKENEI